MRYLFSILALFIFTAGLLFSCPTGKKEEQNSRPNILFAIADDQSFPYASAYGTTGISTPAFDKVAKQGVLFNNAFVAAPQCSPSRAAILTGRNIWQIEEAGTHASYFPKKYEVFTNLLEDVGYETGFTGKPWAPGNWRDAGWSRNPVGPEFNKMKSESVPATGIKDIDYFGNFEVFFNQKETDKPFFFWYGCQEPHRVYEDGSGFRAGKKPCNSIVPAFLPDHELVRSDIADYAFEIEWFDKHLGKMLAFLEEKGELENTIVVITADNGMPFPSAKANLQEYGTHVPLAICWPEKIRGNRVVDDLVALIDIGPTFLEIAEVKDMPEMTGKSISKILFAEQQDQSYNHRDYILTGRERHTHARPDNLGYPARAIRTAEFLYVRNFKPERWPAGDPAPMSDNNIPGARGFKPLWPGFHDVDNSPTKLFIMEEKVQFQMQYELAFEKRPSEQLYDIKKDPECVNNIADEEDYQAIRVVLSKKLESELKKQGDPRMSGNGDIFDSYPRISSMRNFPGFKKRSEYNPEYMQEGQKKVK